MGVFAGPDLSENGLVLYLDAANPKNYNLTAVEYLVVGGGGGGGGYHGGGGGAGGLLYSSSHSITPGSAITATIGAGGGAPNSNSNTGSAGGNSVFGSLTAIGGGAGISQGNEAQARNNGGSGGGGCDGSGSVNHPGGSGTSGQGFKGGDVFGSGDQLAVYYGTAGGGGAGGVGGDGGVINGGFGGPGLPFNISGNLAYYGGGGGGTHLGSAGITNYGIGGTGGGGTGGISPSPHNSAIRNSSSGVDGTGGGGGGHLYNNLGGGPGGSGIVIVRYPGPQRATGGTVTSNNGYTIHTFITSGTFTPLVATNNSAILGIPDFSGRNNFGTSVNGPTYSSANSGSIVFDGSNDYATITSGTNFTFGTGDFSMECWYNPAISYANGNGYIFDTGINGTRFQLYVNRLYFMLQGQVANVTTNTGVGIPANTWYHAVGTRVNSIINLYLNGSIIGSNNANYNLSDSGGTIGNYGGGGGYFFNGKISVLRIYKGKGLSAAEISQNFNALRGRFGI